MARGLFGRLGKPGNTGSSGFSQRFHRMLIAGFQACFSKHVNRVALDHQRDSTVQSEIIARMERGCNRTRSLTACPLALSLFFANHVELDQFGGPEGVADRDISRVAATS